MKFNANIVSAPSFLLVLLLTLLSACGGGGSSSNNNGNNNSGNTVISTNGTGTVGAAGGTIATPKGVEIAIPAGSLLGSTTLTLTPIDAIVGLPNDVTLETGSAYRIDWAGAGFAPDGIATIRYPDSGAQPTAVVRNGVARAPSGPDGFVLMCEHGAPEYCMPEQVWIYRQFGATLGACPSESGSGSGSGHGSAQTGRVTGQAPVISNQPVSVTRALNQAANFSVSAVGSGSLSYQWRRNGVNIANSTSSAYTINAVSNDDNGARFSVVVKNAFGSVTSTEAVLLIAAPDAPTISQHPQGLTVTAGQAAAFHVAGGNAISMTIAWERSNDGSIWDTVQAAVSATDSTYTLNSPTVADDDGALFRAVLCNNGIASKTCVTSAAAILSVVPMPIAPTFLRQPWSTSVVTGETATFTVVANGTPAPEVRIYLAGTAGAADVEVTRCSAGVGTATACVYTTGPLAESQSGSEYYATATNSSASVSSDHAVLTVVTGVVPVFIALQPVGVTLPVGDTAVLHVQAGGTAPFSYQWRLNGTPLVDRSSGSGVSGISGANTSTLTISNTQNADAGDYSVLIGNSRGYVTSAAAPLTIGNRSQLCTGPGNTGWCKSTIKSGYAGLFLAFASSTKGIAVGDGMYALRTADGGVTWYRSMALSYGTPWDIAYADSNTVLVVSLNHDTLSSINQIFRSTDGGDTWTPVYSVAYPGDPEATNYVDRLGQIVFADANLGLVAAGTSILRTTDGGATWTAVDMMPYQPFPETDAIFRVKEIVFPGDGSALALLYANGAGNVAHILRSTDGGQTWTPFASASGFPLLALSKLSFVDANRGVAAIWTWTTGSNDPPQIARTTDGGKTWNLVPVAGTTHGAHYFTSIKMTPDGVAVAVTDTSEIARSADFGATWQWVQSGVIRKLTEVDSPSPGVFVILGWDATDAVVLRNTQGGAGP